MKTLGSVLFSVALLAVTSGGVAAEDAASGTAPATEAPAAAEAASVGGDATAGERVFKKCMTCHRIGPGAKNAVGPEQNGLVGRPAGSVPKFAYSALNKSAGAAGLVWTEEHIFAYLPDPNAFLKKFLTDNGHADKAVGVTKMAFKLADEKERRDVIAYIKQFPAE
jgi:cytochrome c